MRSACSVVAFRFGVVAFPPPLEIGFWRGFPGDEPPFTFLLPSFYQGGGVDNSQIKTCEEARGTPSGGSPGSAGPPSS